jgi:hypothetical protein
MPRSLRSALSIFLFTAVFPATMAWAQPSIVESEPNETPADAGVVAGDVVIIGSLAGSDQDAFLWTVSDVDALKRWTFELRGVPGRLTLVEVVRLEYAENGVDVTGYQKLMKLGTRDGLSPVLRENLLFEPGEYLLGIAGAGGGDGGVYRPPAASITFGEEAEAGIDAAPEPGGYRLLISEGKRLPIDSSPKARGSRETAHKARLGSETAALLEPVSSWYRFDFSKQEIGQRWNITAQIPVGRKATAQLLDSSGATLASAKSDTHGRLLFADLAPPAAPWWVDLQKKDADGYIHAIVAEKTGQRVTGEEAEPNGSWDLANRVDLSQPVTARFGTKGEADYFRFTLDEVTTDQYLAFNLDNPSGGKMRFCLLDSGGTQVQCRDISGNLSLGDLVLPPGEWGLSVSRGAEGTAYSITLETHGAINPAREAEPNDAVKHASSVPANNRIKGRFSGKETDFYRFVVTDEPQLWRFQVIGDGIGEVGYHDIKGTQVMRVRPKSGQRRIRLDNVFLMPGVHYLKVYGKDGGEYTVLARPVGPPDPNGEREPNNDNTGTICA